MEKDGVAVLSNDELRSQLLRRGEVIGPITDSTRSIFVRQLQSLLGNGSPGHKKDPDNGLETSMDGLDTDLEISSVIDSSSSQLCYFGVCPPVDADLSTIEADFQPVYTDKNRCLATIRKLRGARFKSFQTYDEALDFSKEGTINLAFGNSISTNNSESKSCVSEEKPSPFRGPKSQDTVKFRKAIERGDLAYCEQHVGTNPRYLVSSGDTPTILKEGMRYNGLHVACSANQPLIAAKILSTVGDYQFFQKLYPDDWKETSERRSQYLVDLYLNTPDKALNETPLHYACKHGALECVRILATYPACDKFAKNKLGQIPEEVICTRATDENNSDEIKELLGKLCYVPLLRDDDFCLSPQIGQLWSPTCSVQTVDVRSHHNSSPASSSPYNSAMFSPHLKLKGYAGPMSPTKAEVFRRHWKSGSNSSPGTPLGKVRGNSRLPDLEKGIECVGRDLACEFKVGWSEYWNFMDDFANLSTQEGLTKLELYLKKKYHQMLNEKSVQQGVDLAKDLQSKLEALQNSFYDVLPADTTQLSSSSRSTMSLLCQDLEGLQLNASMSPLSLDEPSISASRHHLQNLNIRNDLHENDSELMSSFSSFSQELPMVQLNYLVQSCHVTAQRLADMMTDLAADLQSERIEHLSISRMIRSKVKPEITCLKNVIEKCIATSDTECDTDHRFIHVLLASKTVQLLREALPPSEVSLLHETLKVVVSQFGSSDGYSSDEEEWCSRVETKSKGCDDFVHFTCVLRCLHKVLNAANKFSFSNCDNSSGLLELDDCQCNWLPVSSDTTSDTKDIKTDTPTIVHVKYQRAHNFLHKTLFGEDEQPPHSQDNKNKLNDIKLNNNNGVSFVKQRLIFSAEEINDKNQQSNETFENEVNSHVDCTKEKARDIEVEPTSDDHDSFVTADSSADELMLTPEEGVKIYINSCEASKVDLDVLAAIGHSPVDAAKFPYVWLWKSSIDSHSPSQRESWVSPFIRRARERAIPSASTGSSLIFQIN